jgi:hypothetical protein
MFLEGESLKSWAGFVGALFGTELALCFFFQSSRTQPERAPVVVLHRHAVV